jgi:glyoxylase-like metal-dependent hydrolase (beta-lactamase superfamily II)
MRRILWGALLVVAVLTAVQAGPARAGGLTKIAENVFAYVGEPDAGPKRSFAANAGLVIGDDCVLVVDTLLTAKEGRRLFADIRKITAKPIRFVVNTHFHRDHTLGNSVFAGLGAVIVSHSLERESMLAEAPKTLAGLRQLGLGEADLRDTAVTVPHVTFSERMTIHLGKQVVELIHLGPSHTAGSSVVYLPRQKVLFAGDILFTNFHPFLGSADLLGWKRALEAVEAMDVVAIVPGHGPLSTKKDVDELREYLAIFDAKGKEVAAREKDPLKAAAELEQALPRRAQGRHLIERNLRLKYLAQ